MSVIKELRKRYNPQRLKEMDLDYLSFEEDSTAPEDLERILKASDHNIELDNPNNSAVLYLLGITHTFDFERERCDTIGGSPPDIDTDYEKLKRREAIEWVIETWGEDNVAYIATTGVFKPKSLIRRYYKTVEGDRTEMNEILKKIPQPVSGFEPDVAKVLEANPELEENHKPLVEFLVAMEGVIKDEGIHAAGLVVANHALDLYLPITQKTDKEEQPDGSKKEIVKRVSEYDKDLVEELGHIKFDFLGLETLDVIKEVTKLVQDRHGVVIDPWTLPDHDEKAYALMSLGLLTGLFQMETSNTALELCRRIQPQSIGEIADISALNRPGPLKAGLHEIYIGNKNNGFSSGDLTAQMEYILKDTYWTIVYQEDVMRVCSEIAGFSPIQADKIRKAMGKKKIKVLEKMHPKFISGAVANGMSEADADELWESMAGFAEYGFNKSHAIAYSILTYACAWLKAHYPIEFFAGSLSTRSKTMQPKKWAAKVPEYVLEAKEFGINILPPSINRSEYGFTISENNIYFGMSGIKDVSKRAVRSIMRARRKTPFTDIVDFLSRVNRSELNVKVFTAMVESGMFDELGYSRETLKAMTPELYSYFKDMLKCVERNQAADEREREREELLPIVARKKDLKRIQRLKSGRELTPEELEFLETHEKTRMKPSLQKPDQPTRPEVPRVDKFFLSVQALILQGDRIGCHLNGHPAKIIFPEAKDIPTLYSGSYSVFAGTVTRIHKITTKRGKNMCFMEINDGLGSADCVVFPNTFANLVTYKNLPEVGNIVAVKGKIEEDEPMVKAIVDRISIYRS